MSNHGFLGTAASFVSDLVLLLETAIGAGLLLGAWFARMKRFKWHAWCQSTLVLLNLAVIVIAMMPSFYENIVPRIPARLAKSYYGLATAHATLGVLTEIAGLYILLSAGTNLLPEQLRITRYKAWMRSVLVLWWTALLLGIATYLRWYALPSFAK